jgi:hypothetical protein
VANSQKSLPAEYQSNITVRDFVPLQAVIAFADLDHQHTAFRIIITLFFAKSIYGYLLLSFA